MAKSLPPLFQRFELTEQEIADAYIFSPVTRMFLENWRSDCMQRRLAMSYDPEKPMVFMQEEAEIKGQLLLLDSLLNPQSNTVKES